MFNHFSTCAVSSWNSCIDLFSIFFVIVHVSQPYRTVWGNLTILFSCLCSHVCFTLSFLVQSLWLFLSLPFVLFPYHTFPLFPLLIVKLVTSFISSQSCPSRLLS